MTMQQITERVRAIVGRHGRLLVDVGDLADDDDLYEAGMTSHASVSVMIALEDDFGVEFPQAMLRKATFRSMASMAHVLSGLAAGVPGDGAGSPASLGAVAPA